MSLKLDRLQRSVSLVDRDGLPSSQFQIFWQRTMEAVENSINDLIDILTRLGVVEAAAEDVRIDLEETRQAPVILQSSSPKFANGYVLSSTPTISFSFAGGLAEADFIGTTSNVPEGSRLYFTDVRARNALSGGTGISYNSGTGQIAVSTKLAAYDSGDTPSAFVLSIVDAADAAAFRAAIGAGTGGGSVISVGATVPTGFTVSGSPVTTSGTLAVSFAVGYSLPTDAAQANWNTAFGWGNHAAAGYALASRTLTAGSGLTGGGDLSANRSFAIDTSVVVTLTGSQTLTNKTLSAPTITQTPVYSSTPGPNHVADLSGAAISLANGATVDFPNFSGPIFVNDQGSGGTALYLCGGNNVLSVGASQPIGGTMAFNGGVAGYTFTNTSGGTRTFGFASTKLRAFS